MCRYLAEHSSPRISARSFVCFGIHYRVPRGTEPHLALQRVGTCCRNYVLVSLLNSTPKSIKLSLRGTHPTLHVKGETCGHCLPFTVRGASVS
jgi:hypothetical protein